MNSEPNSGGYVVWTVNQRNRTAFCNLGKEGRDETLQPQSFRKLQDCVYKTFLKGWGYGNIEQTLARLLKLWPLEETNLTMVFLTMVYQSIIS